MLPFRRLLVRLRVPALLAVVATASLAEGSRAQQVLLDEGAFEISRDGEVIGTESFTVHRVGLGSAATIVVQGDVQIGDLRIRPILETATTWEPIAFRSRFEGSREATLSIRSDGRRLLAVTVTREGEGEREYRLGSTTALLPRDVAFLYHVVAAQVDAGVVTVVEPGEGTQMRLPLVDIGEERFSLGGRSLLVRRYRLGTETPTEILVDARGRVMAVEIPDRAYVARRTRVGS
jgi:hypothetical protein